MAACNLNSEHFKIIIYRKWHAFSLHSSHTYLVSQKHTDTNASCQFSFNAGSYILNSLDFSIFRVVEMLAAYSPTIWLEMKPQSIFCSEPACLAPLWTFYIDSFFSFKFLFWQSKRICFITWLALVQKSYKHITIFSHSNSTEKKLTKQSSVGKEADKSHTVLGSPTMAAGTAQSQSSAPEQGAMLGYRFWDSVVNSLTFDIGDLTSLKVEKQNKT